MQTPHIAAQQAALAKNSVTWQRWLAQLEQLLKSNQFPSLLVVAHWGGSAVQKKRGERVLAANDQWLDLCEYSTAQVVGRAFTEIPGFQGPLTTDQCKLQLAGLLISERSSVDNLEVVNYAGRTGRAIHMKLKIDILKWRAQNMVFLCSIVGHRDALPIERTIAGSGRAAAIAIVATRTPKEAEPGADKEHHKSATAPPSLSALWKYMLECHSQVVDVCDKQDGDSSITCAICCCECDVEDAPRALACGHTFHTSCISTWFVHQLQATASKWILPPTFCSDFSCPTCKQDPFGARQTQVEEDAALVPCRPKGNPIHKAPKRRWFPSCLSKTLRGNSVQA
jgi:hypothetical protein